MTICRYCRKPIHQLETTGVFVHTGLSGAPWFHYCGTVTDDDGNEHGGRPATPGTRH